MCLLQELNDGIDIHYRGMVTKLSPGPYNSMTPGMATALIQQQMRDMESPNQDIFEEFNREVDNWGARRREDLEEERVPDINLPVINLSKMKPVVEEPGKLIYSCDWKLKVLEQSELDIYDKNCISYEFKDGKVFLTFKLDTKTAGKIHFQKGRVNRIRITHYDMVPTPVKPVLIMEYSVKFSHIEMLNNKNTWLLDMTIVYKLLDSHYPNYDECIDDDGF